MATRYRSPGFALARLVRRRNAASERAGTGEGRQSEVLRVTMQSASQASAAFSTTAKPTVIRTGLSTFNHRGRAHTNNRRIWHAESMA